MYYQIKHLDGRYIASTFSDAIGAWYWVCEIMAEEFGCDSHEIHVLETDDGDKLTVRGVPQAVLVSKPESGEKIVRLLSELRQCQREIEEAANLLRPQLPGMASIYDAVAKRVAKTLLE